MIKFEQLFSEGVYDPNIFKAIFLAGGPGSGKSYVAGKTIRGQGLKTVNSDDAFEKGLKKAKLTTAPDDIASAQGQAVRAKARPRGVSSLGRCIMQQSLVGKRTQANGETHTHLWSQNTAGVWGLAPTPPTIVNLPIQGRRRRTRFLLLLSQARRNRVQSFRQLIPRTRRGLFPLLRPQGLLRP